MQKAVEQSTRLNKQKAYAKLQKMGGMSTVQVIAVNEPMVGKGRFTHAQTCTEAPVKETKPDHR